MKLYQLFSPFGLLCATMLAAIFVLGSCNAKSASSADDEKQLMPNTLVLNDGTTTVTWIKDNPGHAMREPQLFGEVPDSIISQLGLEKGIPSSISTFLLHVDGKWVLFDTGLGIGRGQLVQTLDSLGLSPDSISALYITHFHADHIGGMVHEGKAVFPKAEVYAGEREYNAWIKEMPSDKTQMQQEAMAVYKDRLHLFLFGDTLPHGVIALDAVGHTPGHVVFQKDNLLIIGDLLHGAALQIPYPEYCAAYDMDPEQAVISRRRILQYAADKHLIMAGMHLGEPAFIEP